MCTSAQGHFGVTVEAEVCKFYCKVACNNRKLYVSCVHLQSYLKRQLICLAAKICCRSPLLPCLYLHLSAFREEEAIQLDGLNAAQIKELREKSEKHAFQAEVNRMMKLIINSLYKNKEVGRNNLYSTLCLHIFI